MAIASDALVIGLTGPFGSGATTSAGILADRLQFEPIKLSAVIRDEAKLQGNDQPTRAQLQELGDELRESGGAAVLAERTVKKLDEAPKVIQRLAIDGIRNVGEIQFLKRRFGLRFFLFAFECPASERWERLKPQYEKRGQGHDDFSADDKRDKDEEGQFGQQVELCVDRSDVLIVNDDDVTHVRLQKKLVQYVKLVSGEEPRYATAEEILMNQAYSASHGSKCLKRQVGAVLVAAPAGQMGEIVGTGFNENPPPTCPCVEEPMYGADPKKGIRGSCYRDKVRFDTLNRYARQHWHCGECGEPLIEIPADQPEPPWKCAKCRASIDRQFFPERAMWWCTAVHAEVAALMAAGHRARGSTLYTTTFPCFQCAEKIAQAGVAGIVFTEPYPDTLAGDRLALAKIKTGRFEGVRSSRFHEIFSAVRPYFEKKN